MPKQKKDIQVLPVAALLLAWLIPGAGHIYIGRIVRGLIIMFTVAATFWAGIALGGVTTVDKQNERWWFVADMFAGVHGIITWRLSERVYDNLEAELKDNPQFIRQAQSLMRTNGRAGVQALEREYFSKMLSEKGLKLTAPTETVARAYAGIAGLLNLLCIFDAVILTFIGTTFQSTREKHRSAELSEAA